MTLTPSGPFQAIDNQNDVYAWRGLWWGQEVQFPKGLEGIKLKIFEDITRQQCSDAEC